MKIGLVKYMFFFLLLTMLTSCSNSDSGKNRLKHLDKADNITIALVWPWQGTWSNFGKGAALATAELNNQGGVLGKKIKLLNFDDKGSVEQGLIIAEELVENPNVVAAIGTVNSYIAVVTAPNYRRSNLLFLTPGSRVSAVTKNNQPYVFRLTVNEQQLQQYTVHYLAKNHMKNILLYYVNDDDGQDAANKFEYFANQSGLNLMARRAYEQDIDDYKTVLKNWQLLYQIDALVLYGDLPHVADIIKTARQVGIKAPIIGTPSMFNPELITLAGDAANGVIVPTVGMISSQNSGYINFAKNYQAQYRAMPDYAAIMGYDSVLLLANVIKQAGTLTPSKLIKQLHNANGYQGLLMHYQFDSIGDLRKPSFSLWQIQNEKFVKIFPLSENNKD